MASLPLGKSELITRIFKYMLQESTPDGDTGKAEIACRKTCSATGLKPSAIATALSDTFGVPASIDKPESSIDHASNIAKYVAEERELSKARKIIMELSLAKNMCPQHSSLLQALNKNLSPYVSKKCLDAILKKLNMKFYGEVLIENNEVRRNRINFIRQSEKLRQEGVNIVYLYMNKINTYKLFRCCTAQFELYEAEKIDFDQKYYIEVAHAADTDGFIENTLCAWRFSKSKSVTIEHECKKAWLIKNVLPKVPIDSVIVCDKKIVIDVMDKTPNWSSNTRHMQSWLQNHGISIKEGVCRPEIYKLVKQYKANFFEYEYGIKCLLLPNYHQDLNPLARIWNRISDAGTFSVVAEVNKIIATTIGDLSINMTAEDWFESCQKTKQYIVKILNQDELYDSQIDELNITAPSESSDEDPDIWESEDEMTFTSSQ